MNSKIIDIEGKTFVQPKEFVLIVPENFPTLIGVWVKKNEEVEFNYVYTPYGQICNGYTIKEKQ